ncbi:MAG: DUF503 domain-containing protein [bacterium]
MPVGICHIQFQVPSSESLKDKRRVVKSLKDKLRNRFNIAIAETGGLDSWRKCELGFVSISNDSAYLEGLISSVIRTIESDLRVIVTDFSMEIL